MQSTAWDLVVMGGVNSDFMARGGKPPAPGEMTSANQFYEGPGGKDERGEKMRRHLVRENVDPRYVTSDHKAPTGAALIWVADVGEKRIVSVAGANECLTPEEVHAAADTLRGARVVLMPLEVPLACVLAAVEIAAANIPVVLDSAPPTILEAEP